MYDGVLRIKAPKYVHIIGFADNIDIVVIAKNIEDIVTITSATIPLICDWLETKGFILTESKTEVVLITGRKTRETATSSLKVVNYIYNNTTTLNI